MKSAKVYAARFNWSVIPLHDVTSGVCSCPKGADCSSAGKHPRIAEWQKLATSDAVTIDAWISAYPSANVGVVTGTPSGFFVLDVDPGNGGDQTLAALVEKHGALPPTAQQQTGSGGAHYLFRLPDFPVVSRAHAAGHGLDTRGDGGQIVVAPSVSAKGVYRWIHPPWSTEIADAPPWLLNLLRQRPTRAVAPTAPRATFPPASPEVLADAAEALERHGPAIEGKGGDDHTYVACALTVNDFALTEAEAWPLLYEWNATCRPPWSDADLASKMRGGSKYATRDYGCRRVADAFTAAKTLVTDWQAAGGDENAMFTMIERVRPLAATTGDPAKRAVLEVAIQQATGLGPKAQALPKVRAPPDIPPGGIEMTPRLHDVADQAIVSISPHVFARNGVLCQVTKAEHTFINDLETPAIQDLMSRASTYTRTDDKGTVERSAPMEIASILHSRRGHPDSVRVLEAVTTAPIFLADGTILSERGYNAQARVFLEPSVTVQVADHPDRDDAVAAVAVFRDLLGEFKFISPADFSSWLAGLLSPLVKAATGNAPAPLICVSASNAGSGKSLLTEIVAQVVTGEPAELSPYNPKDPGEWGKRLTAFVKAASPVRVLDNCNGPIGDEGLDRLITASRWSDRILGASEAPPLPNVTTWFATGNNVEPVGDTVRRVLMVRIEVDVERPQERTGFRFPLENRYALEHRSELLTAALTILRAYHCAGRPAQTLPSWGSFTTWSALIRGALVWAGCADPFLTQQRCAAQLNEADNDAHDFWIDVIEASDSQKASIATLANSRAHDVIGAERQITPWNLHKFVGRYVDKPRAGRRIRRDPRGYYVERIS